MSEPAAPDAALAAAQKPASAAPPSSVLARTAAGMGWIVTWRGATRVLGLVSTLILVRLLAPADFGLVALGTGFAQAVDTLSMLGVEDALVRERAPTPEMYDTAFTINALRSLGTATVIAALGQPVAHFFGEPRLATVLYALAVGAVIQATSSIGVIDFRRDMVFHKEFQLNIVPRLVGVAVTLTTAVLTRSYWALIAGIISSQAVRVMFSYRMHPYRPRPTLRAWRSLIAFSLWTWAVSMVDLTRARIDTFVVGRVIDATHVGIYSIGEEIAALPTTELILPLGRAAFSGFTAARHGGGSVADTFMRAVSTMFLISLPAGLGISLVAGPVVRLAVGQSWAAAIPVIQILGVMGSLTVFAVMAGTLLSVYGQLRPLFVNGVCCLLLRLALLVPLVARYGVVGGAAGSLIGAALEQASLVVIAFRRFRLSYRTLWQRIWRILVAAAAMAAGLDALGLGWRSGDVGGTRALAVQLGESVVAGAAIYAVTLLLLWLACGRPAGAEADLLAALGGLRRHMFGWLRALGSRMVAPRAQRADQRR